MIEVLRREGDLGRAGRRRSAERADELLALLLAHRGQRHLDALDARQRLHRGRHVLRDPVAQRAAFDREQDVDPDGAAVDLDAIEHADVLDRTADLGVVHAPEGLADLCLGDHR